MRIVRVLAMLGWLTGTAMAESPEQQVLALVNRYRADVGLAPVRLDAKLSKGCTEHAEYMRLNADTPAMVGLNAHHQDPSLPGASAAGAACGKAADLFPGVSDLGAAVSAWMSGLYHRRPILTPGLTTIGVGYAPNGKGELMAALMFVDGADVPDKWPVAYPARDQRDVPLEFGNEIPNPIPGGGPGGYPITLQFPPFDPVTAVTATLVDGDHKPVPFHMSTPERPATSFGQYGVVCLIPKLPMRPRTTYTASVTATWKSKKAIIITKTWSFTTIGLAQLDGNDAAAVARAVGTPSLVRGIVQHAGMMDTDTVFLALAGGTSKSPGMMVSVLIPKRVWGKRGDPDKLVGKTIEAEAAPQLVQGKYLNLTIGVESQLRVVK